MKNHLTVCLIIILLSVGVYAQHQTEQQQGLYRYYNNGSNLFSLTIRNFGEERLARYIKNEIGDPSVENVDNVIIHLNSSSSTAGDYIEGTGAYKFDLTLEVSMSLNLDGNVYSDLRCNLKGSIKDKGAYFTSNFDLQDCRHNDLRFIAKKLLSLSSTRMNIIFRPIFTENTQKIIPKRREK